MSEQATRSLAVVTGASSGIGLELAKLFIQNGFDVVVAADEAEIDSVATTLSANGGTARPVRCDLATFEGVEQLVAAVESIGSPVDALALNAGVGNGGAFLDIPLEDELRLIQLNVSSTVHLAKRLLPGMVERGEGRVLITASVASLMPGPYYATYAASKSFGLSFAEAIRHELKDTGVTVTALMPGPTDTEFFERADMQDAPVDSAPKDDPAEVARDGFEALMAGKDHVVAGGLKNKAQALGSKTMTDPMKAAVHARMTKPEQD